MCVQNPFFLHPIRLRMRNVGENTDFSTSFQQKLDKAF
ncbi:hypothetical protein RSPO_c00724 [Ralstonia solanacearum Po82]|uniref:Uncharacterized protein n=1 Tax=Ralstonia solanacearum (strain Po82) TaxID=1031711 RepID=F6FY69_RALS8|nr:hypothetical protein RSPO_c00724 [Ralstonia solanacearum Po82]